MILLYILAALLVLILAVGGYLFFTACKRWKGIPWLEPEEVLKTNFAPHVESIQNTSKWLEENNAQDLWLTAQDGVTLHGLWVSAEKPIGTILCCHGYHSTYLVDFGMCLRFYHNMGLNLLIPEQRCHGKSGGKYTTFGVKESGDMLQWLAYHNEELYQGDVVLTGMSMGASTVMFMADSLPGNVKGLIADCGFTSPAGIIGKVFRDVTHLPPVPWIYGAEVFARLLAGFSLWQKDTRKTLAKNTLPILMVHGLADDFVPCEMSRQGFACCGGDKQLLLAEGAGHGVSFLAVKEEYVAKIKHLMQKALGEKYELRNH